MMKQIGFDVVMLSAVLFGVLAASMSISEEIEGRTAIVGHRAAELVAQSIDFSSARVSACSARLPKIAAMYSGLKVLASLRTMLVKI